MKKNRREAGVTLIEMMVVVTIIALFAALVLPSMMGTADKARVTAARAQINAYTTALGAYKLDTGVFPTTEQGLQALRVPSPRASTIGRVLIFRRTSETIRGAIPTCIAIPASTAMSPIWSATAPTAARRRRESMPTSSVGKTNSGVTLIELVVVVALISIMVGISFPAITSGIDSLRLNAAANSIVAFFNTGLSRAERRQQVVEITILKARNSLEMHSSEPGFVRTLELPEGSIDYRRASAAPRAVRRAAHLSAVPRRHRAALWRSTSEPQERATDRADRSHHRRSAHGDAQNVNRRGFTLARSHGGHADHGHSRHWTAFGAFHLSTQRRAAHRLRSRHSAGPAEDGRASDRQGLPKLTPFQGAWDREVTGGVNMGWRARLTPFEMTAERGPRLAVPRAHRARNLVDEWQPAADPLARGLPSIGAHARGRAGGADMSTYPSADRSGAPRRRHADGAAHRRHAGESALGRDRDFAARRLERNEQGGYQTDGQSPRHQRRAYSRRRDFRHHARDRRLPSRPAKARRVKIAFFQGEAASMRLASTYSLQQGSRGPPMILEFQVIPGENNQGVRLVVNERLYTGPARGRPDLSGGGAGPAHRRHGAPNFLPISVGANSFVLADKLSYCRFSLPRSRAESAAENGWPAGPSRLSSRCDPHRDGSADARSWAGFNRSL